MHSILRSLAAIFTAMLVLFATPLRAADPPKFNVEQLDQMLAPIALFPDALLSQVLMATTYPKDVAEAAEWAFANRDLKGDDAVKAVQDKPWDPSVQSLVAFPQVLAMLGEKPEWVHDLGDAFLAQPKDVMDSVQFLRSKAKDTGNLSSNEQQIVTVEAAPPAPQTIVVTAPPPPAQIITIAPANPQVVFVPIYNPVHVFGPWWHPLFPPFFFPPPVRWGFGWNPVSTAIWWGVGIGVTNALWGGVNWGRRDVNINVNQLEQHQRQPPHQFQQPECELEPQPRQPPRCPVSRRSIPAIACSRATSANAAAARNFVVARINGRRHGLHCRIASAPRIWTAMRCATLTATRFRSELREAQAPRRATVQRQSIAVRCKTVPPTSTVARLGTASPTSDRSQVQDRAGNVDRSQARDRVANVDRSQVQDRAANIDRSRAQDRASNIDRSQVQDRAANVDRSQARDRASNIDRSQAQNRAANIDRSQAQNRAANVDRRPAPSRNESAARTNRDNALRGANDGRQTRQQIDRGNASRAAQQRTPNQRQGNVSRPAGGGGARRRPAATQSLIMGPTMKDRMMSNRWFKSAAALLFTLALSVPLCAAAGPQKTFATPEIAVEALVDSLARNDDAELRAILGLNSERLMSLDDLSAEDRLGFSRGLGKRASHSAGQRLGGAPRSEQRLDIADSGSA